MSEKLGRKSFIELSALGFFTFYLSWYFDELSRIGTALAGKKVVCLQPNENKFDYPYDVIAVLGAGVETTGNNQTLNDYQKIRLEAAAVAYLNKLAPRVIILDGQLPNGTSRNISRNYLQNRVDKYSLGWIQLPSNRVFVDTQSVNTASNIKELSKFVREHNLNQIALISDQFHIPRGTTLACNHGLNVQGFAAADLILEKFPKRQSELERLYSNQILKPQLLKEIVALLELMVDPYGDMTTIFRTNKNLMPFRAQIDNVIGLYAKLR